MRAEFSFGESKFKGKVPSSDQVGSHDGNRCDTWRDGKKLAGRAGPARTAPQSKRCRIGICQSEIEEQLLSMLPDLRGTAIPHLEQEMNSPPLSLFTTVIESSAMVRQ